MKNLKKEEIIRLMQLDYTQKQMAKELKCSIPTLRRYLDKYDLRKGLGEYVPVTGEGLQDDMNAGKHPMKPIPITREQIKSDVLPRELPAGRISIDLTDEEKLGTSKESYVIMLKTDKGIELPLKELLECTADQLLGIAENYDAPGRSTPVLPALPAIPTVKPNSKIPRIFLEKDEVEPTDEEIQREHDRANLMTEWAEKGDKKSLVRKRVRGRYSIVKPQDPYSIRVHDIEDICKKNGGIVIKVKNGPKWTWTKEELRGGKKKKRPEPQVMQSESDFEDAYGGYGAEIVV